MGAFLNNLYEEGSLPEIAFWIGKLHPELSGKQYTSLINAKTKLEALKILSELENGKTSNS